MEANAIRGDLAGWGGPSGHFAGSTFEVTSVAEEHRSAATSTPSPSPAPLRPAAEGNPNAPLPANLDLVGVLGSTPGFQGAWVTPGPTGSTNGSELTAELVVVTPEIEQRVRALTGAEIGEALRLHPIFA